MHKECAKQHIDQSLLRAAQGLEGWILRYRGDQDFDAGQAADCLAGDASRRHGCQVDEFILRRVCVGSVTRRNVRYVQRDLSPSQTPF